MSALDAAIDELYKLPLTEFTARRNQLAKERAGDERAQVKALEKPTVIPWTVNQVYWRARPAYDKLMKAGAALRAAQIDALEGRGSRVAKATAAHREALSDATTRGLHLASQHDVQPSAEPLTRMLEALSLSPTPPPHPGRWTEIVQPSGFEALLGVVPAAPPPPTREKKGARGAGSRPEPHKDDAARQAQREAAESAAEAALAQARERESRAKTVVAEARRQLADAESALDAAREDVQAADAALRSAQKASKGR